MIQTKILTIKKETIFILTKFVLLMSVAVFAPLIHNQAITGPIVNAVLFISVFITGIRGAVLIAFIPSVIALSTGLLSLVLAPMIPFIIIGNIILVLSFSFLKDKNYWLGIVSASFLKFVFLFSVSYIISSKLVIIMSWPQLITALAGGAIAFLVLKSIKKI